MQLATSTRVLVVEDEALVADDIQRTLQRLGYEVPSTAGSGAEAVELAQALRPALVLMDINLGAGMDGIEAARQLRARLGVPVIFLTSYSDDTTLRRALSSQPYSYLTKPFGERELRTAIEVALNRHRLEAELAAREEWFRTTLSSIGDAVIAIDPQERVTFVNPSAARLLGEEPRALVGRPLGEVFRLMDLSGAPIPSPLRQARDAPDPSGKLVRMARSAALPPLEIDDTATAIVDERGTVLGAVVVFRDVTEARALEQRLRRTERLASLGTLSAGIAHEINNPLAAVLLNTQLLESTLETIGADVDGLDAEAGAPLERTRSEVSSARDALRDTRSALDRITRIIDSVRRFARADTSARKIHSLERLVDTGLALMRIVLTRTARLEVHHHPAPTVLVDEGEFLQVLSNVLTNASFAVKDRGSEGIISLRTGTGSEGQALVEIHDNGSGVAPEVLPRIFDPFFTTKPVGVGTGLGLSISHDIITAHGGTLALESPPGDGTTVRITLPAHS